MKKEQILLALKECLVKNKVDKIIFSKSEDKTVKKAQGKLIKMKSGIFFQVEKFLTDGKALHENIPLDKAGDFLVEMAENYRQINVIGGKSDFQILKSKKGDLHSSGSLAPIGEETVIAEHDREKKRILEEGKPIGFLIHLGVSDERGNIYKSSRDKYRQINRFLEFIDDLKEYFPKNKPVKVVDFGCGKSYLTFAIHYYLTEVLGLETDITGLDLKPDVIQTCEDIVKKLNLSGIRFLQGDINEFAPLENVDMTVSLHACDTATDAALAQAVHSNSKLIVSVPCCHHEAAKVIKCEALSPVLEHGILKQRIAETVTDALRAKYLEALGYKVQVFEFIESEHTPKNLMIRAVNSGKPSKKALGEYNSLCEFLNISPSISKMIKK